MTTQHEQGRGRAEELASRDAAAREVLLGRRQRRSRVVPIPVALAAIALPFLCAWAAGADGPAEIALRRPTTDGGPALDVLDRTRRLPEDGEAYVDVHGPALPWEAELLVRQGYVSAVPPHPR